MRVGSPGTDRRARDIVVERIVILHIDHRVARLRRAEKPSVATLVLAGLDHPRVRASGELQPDAGVVIPDQNLVDAFDAAQRLHDQRQVLRAFPRHQARADRTVAGH